MSSLIFSEKYEKKKNAAVLLSALRVKFILWQSGSAILCLNLEVILIQTGNIIPQGDGIEILQS